MTENVKARSATGVRITKFALWASAVFSTLVVLLCLLSTPRPAEPPSGARARILNVDGRRFLEIDAPNSDSLSCTSVAQLTNEGNGVLLLQVSTAPLSGFGLRPTIRRFPVIEDLSSYLPGHYTVKMQHQGRLVNLLEFDVNRDRSSAPDTVDKKTKR